MHWTIIGGGLQGTTIAIQLRELGLSRDKLTIIDPYATLCEQFNDFSHRISMPYLRSPIVHHIHLTHSILKNSLKFNNMRTVHMVNTNVHKQICLCIMFTNKFIIMI